MEILLTMTYVALCYATFKLFRIPVNQWTLATAALGGIFGLSLLFITMAYNHPFSTNARIYFTVTPILPGVRGRVVEVPVEDRTNQHLEAGEVLFKIDPKPYEYTVAEKRRDWPMPRPMLPSSRRRLIKPRRRPERLRRNWNWPKRTTIVRRRCSRNKSSRRRRSIPQRAISTRQNRQWPKLMLRKIVPGRRMARLLMANIRRSCVFATNLLMLNSIWTRPLFAHPPVALSPSSRCGRACMWSRRPSVQP